MQPRMINLGWAMARIELASGDDGSGEKPLLTICWPSANSEPAGSIEIWHEAGLEELSATLFSFLMDWRVERTGDKEGDIS